MRAYMTRRLASAASSLRHCRGENDDPIRGGEQILKVPMVTDSRKAQRTNYAQHRAHLLFSGLTHNGATQAKRSAPLAGADLSLLTESVRAGLIGFVPTTSATLLDVGAPGDA